MTLYPRILICACIALLMCLSCSRRPSQEEMEAQTLRWVDKWVRLYEVKFPGITITNLDQVYRGLDRAYPHSVHDELKPYGKHAGFKTSFFEKYVFFPLGNTSHWAQGEVAYMNAQPFPLREGNGMGRRLVFRNSSYRYHTMSEERVQRMLTEDGLKPLPLGTISLPPPRPPEPEIPFHFRIQEKFWRACGKLGLGLEATANLWRLAVFSPILLLGLLGLWFWRSRHRRVQDEGT